MKSLDLENFGVQEMDAREVVDVDGGTKISINPWQAVATWLIVDSLNNPKEFFGSMLKGFKFN